MQVRGEKDYTSLVKGLITERSPILGEEQACQDELNFVFDLATGTRVKRKGFRTISAYTPPSLYNPVLRTRFHWADQNLMVDVYQETTTHDGRRDTVFVFVDDFAPYNKLAELVVNTTFDSTYTTTVNVSALRELLLVTSGTRILALKKAGPSTVQAYNVEIFIRDFKLIPDGLSIGQRTGILTEEHRYNLYNAGWYAQRKLESTGALGDPLVEFGSSTGTESFAVGVYSASGPTLVLDLSGGYGVPLSVGDQFTFASGPNTGTTFTVESLLFDAEFDRLEVEVTPASLVSEAGSVYLIVNSVSNFPSNADISILGLKADESGNDLFSKATLLNVSMGNSEAPRGHYVYNIKSIDRGSRVVMKSNDGTPNETVALLSSVTW